MKESDDKLENVWFSMVLPPMSLTKPDRLGDFLRVGKGQFAGLHVLHREGKTEFPISRLSEIAAETTKNWYARYGEQMAANPPRPRVFHKAPPENESLAKARETLAKNRAEERALTQPVATQAETTAPKSRPRAKRAGKVDGT